MSFLSARLTKLRVAIGAGAVALGLLAAGAATPAQADDGWRNGHSYGYRAHIERERAIARQRAIEHQRALERAREARLRHQWYQQHRFAPPSHPTPWYFR